VLCLVVIVLSSIQTDEVDAYDSLCHLDHYALRIWSDIQTKEDVRANTETKRENEKNHLHRSKRMYGLHIIVICLSLFGNWIQHTQHKQHSEQMMAFRA